MAREHTLSADVAYGFYCKYGYSSRRLEAYTLVVCLRHAWMMVFYLLHRPLKPLMLRSIAFAGKGFFSLSAVPVRGQPFELNSHHAQILFDTYPSLKRL